MRLKGIFLPFGVIHHSTSALHPRHRAWLSNRSSGQFQSIKILRKWHPDPSFKGAGAAVKDYRPLTLGATQRWSPLLARGTY